MFLLKEINELFNSFADEVFEEKHRRIGTILFEQGHLNAEQIDEVLGAMKLSLS